MTEQKQVLIVEDNDYVDTVMRKLLEQHNFNVTIITDGKKGLVATCKSFCGQKLA